MVNEIPLLKNKKQWLLTIVFLFVIFVLNISYEYYKFKALIVDEVFVSNAKIINIYQKKQYTVLKLQTNNFSFFTSTDKKTSLKQFDIINVYINTTKITFLSYLKGFYAKTFNLQKISTSNYILNSSIKYINKQHTNSDIAQIFNALFFATPINSDLRTLFSNFGISHLVAISGFHLGILAFILYWILHLPYSIIQNKYFPYRNKRFDLLILTSFILFSYLIFTGIVPSLLRSFVMFILGILFLRNNIKVFSFGTLALTTMIIIAIFPKLLFSLSLWFSVAGVFYIFLFVQYFNNFNKIFAFILFNVWIYLSINPIVHFFFGTTSIMQLYSPLFTVGFTIFYPIELFLHIFGLGDLLDSYIKIFLDITVVSKNIVTPTWVFYSYLVVSLFSIPCPKWFRTLNLSFIAFNLWIYLQLF